MEAKLKCMRCGHAYTARDEGKEVVRERVCPRCQSNSVRKLPAKANGNAE